MLHISGTVHFTPRTDQPFTSLYDFNKCTAAWRQCKQTASGIIHLWWCFFFFFSYLSPSDALQVSLCPNFRGKLAESVYEKVLCHQVFCSMATDIFFPPLNKHLVPSGPNPIIILPTLELSFVCFCVPHAVHPSLYPEVGLEPLTQTNLSACCAHERRDMQVPASVWK